MLRRLNRENVRLMLGVWGGPGQFNDDGTRRGALLPEHVDAYAEYVASVVEYLVVGSASNLVRDRGERAGRRRRHLHLARPVRRGGAASSGRAWPSTASRCTARTRPRPATRGRMWQRWSPTRTCSNGSARSPRTSISPTHELPELIADVRAAELRPCRSTSPSTPASGSARWTAGRRRPTRWATCWTASRCTPR